MQMRLDQYLVEMNKARSRTQAKEIIESGMVKVDGRVVKKASYNFREGSVFEVVDTAGLLEWVARSGEKLYDALNRLNISLEGKTCLDVGQSTGGFSQAMLKKEAGSIVGVDVGKGQLNEGIRSNPNVHCYESFDARELIKLKDEWTVGFFAVDVSFISVLKVMPGVCDIVDKAVEGILLIKPQFEVGKRNVKKGGLVEAPLIHLECEKHVLLGLEGMGIQILDYFPSSVRGRDGNQEFICHIIM